MEITSENYTEYLITKSLEVKYGEMKYSKTTYQCNNPTILFIHGSGGTRHWFTQHFIKYDIAAYNWLVPSLFGYEQKEKPHMLEAYTMEQFADDLIQLLVSEKISDLVILGHSMGGKIGVLMVELIGSRVDINLLGFYNLEGPYLIEELTEDDLSIGQGSYQEYIHQFEEYQQSFLDQDTKMAKIMWEHNEKLGSYLIWAVFHNFTRLIKNRNLIDIVRQYKHQICFVYVYGEQNRDKLPTKELYQQENLELIEISNAGHIMLGENPVEFWGKIISSIKKLHS